MPDQTEDLAPLLLHLQAQVVAMRNVLHALIETHPAPERVDALLADYRLKMEAVLGPSVASDAAINAGLDTIDAMRASAQRAVSPPRSRGPES